MKRFPWTRRKEQAEKLRQAQMRLRRARNHLDWVEPGIYTDAAIAEVTASEATLNAVIRESKEARS